jgi:phosphoenolpyruvate synthase/pyruvate phosphate dikinase
LITRDEGTECTLYVLSQFGHNLSVSGGMTPRYDRVRSDEVLMNREKGRRKPEDKDLVNRPVLTGECPTMHKAALGTLEILLDFVQANNYLETRGESSPKILVTTEIDWSWTRILQHFLGVITNKGTRVSRAAEVLVIMDKPGVLGTKNATEVLHSGSEAQIVCWGNEASVHLFDEEAN